MKLSRGTSHRRAGLQNATLNDASSTDAALARAQPLSDKALELERRASALKEVESEELRKAAELNVLSLQRTHAAPPPPPQTHAGDSQR